jgi:ribonuclease HII
MSDLSVGVDEAGRGPLAGAVYAAAVILDPAQPIEGLADSKKISEKKRERLFPEIKEKALAWAISTASVEEIDEINILHASMLAMHRAVDAVAAQMQEKKLLMGTVRVDGNRLPDWPYGGEAVVQGDSLIAEISAASILAKVARDREMLELHEQHPEYCFDRHKGYPTKLHMQLLAEHGPCPQHRRSFGPVKKLL